MGNVRAYKRKTKKGKTCMVRSYTRGGGKSKMGKAKKGFAYEHLWASDDEFDKYAEQGTHSPHEANLMRKGKYKKRG